MTRVALILCVCMSAFAGVVVAAADDAKGPPDPVDRAFVPPGEKDVSRVQVNALVERLAEGDATAQRTAQAQLVALLADAVPRLELLVRESKDEAIRHRAKLVLDDIRKRARFSPAVVTLHATAGPVELLTEIFRQANLPMAKHPLDFVDDGSVPPVTVNFDRRPFWNAVKEVCEASHLDVRHVYDAERLTVTRGENAPVHGPSSVYGPAIVYAENAGQATKIGAENRTGLMRVCVCVEPRVRILGLLTDITTLADENGDPLLPPTAKMSGNGGMCETDFCWQSQLPLSPTRFSRRIARLSGTMRLTIQTEAKTFELPLQPGARPVHAEFAGYTFDILGLDPAGDGHTLKLKLSRGKLEDWQWKWFREPMGRVRMLDEHGVPLRVAGSGTSGDDKEAQCTVTFSPSDGTLTPASGKPAKLVWELPTQREQVDVPFELIDINLPIEDSKAN